MLLSNGRHLYRKIFAWVLTVSMFFYSYGLPFGDNVRTAFAEEPREVQNIETPPLSEEETAPESDEPYTQEPASPYLEQAINENKPIKIDEECDEFTTIFQNPDNTKTAYIFGTPVRYKDQNGNLKEIDSQLVQVSDEKKNEGYGYTNKSNSFDVYLPENIADDVPVQLVFDNYNLEMKPIQAIDLSKEGKNAYSGVINKAYIDFIKNDIKFKNSSEKDKALEQGAAEEIVKSITYNSGFDEDIELVYMATDTGIKEEIVLNKNTGQNEFQFMLKLNGVQPELLEDGRIILKYTDSEEIAGIFPEMYMYDSYDGEEKLEGEHFSEAVSYKLSAGENEGEYIITVVADKTFLEDESTVYPVIIDPTYTNTYSSPSYQYDTYANSAYPTSEYYTSTHLRICRPSSSELTRSFVRHPLFDINGGLIYSAIYKAYEDSGYTSNAYIDLHRIQEAWTDSTLNWSNKPNYASAPYDSELVNGANWYTFNVKYLVSLWYKGTCSNYGFMLKEKYESTTDRKYRRFVSSDGSTKPYLQIVHAAKPSAPTVSTYGNAINSGTGYANLSWAAVPGATAYYVYLDGVYTLTLGSTSCTLNNIPSGKHLFSIRAANEYGQYTYPSATEKTVPDRSRPPEPTTISLTETFSGATGSIKVDWSDVTDVPIPGASGTKNYVVERYTSVTGWGDAHTVTASEYTYNSLGDNTTYKFRVKVYDNNNNYSEPRESDPILIGDYTPPAAPTSYSVSPDTYTNDDTPTISWSGITDDGDNLNKVQYKINSGDWTDIDGTGISNYPAEGTYEIQSASLNIGENTIYIRGVDSGDNEGVEASDTYWFDETPPNAVINEPEDEDAINGIVYVNATVENNDGCSDFDEWVLEYGFGTAPSSFEVLTSSNSTVNNQIIYEWDTTGLIEDENYTLQIRACDEVGNEVTDSITVLKTSDSVNVPAGLQIDVPGGYDPDGYKPDTGDIDQYVISSSSTDVEYQKINDGGIAGISSGKLYVNNVLKDTEATAGDGFTFNAAEYDNGWVYPEGSVVFMYVQSNDSAEEELYSTTTYEALEIADVFEDVNKIENLSNVELFNGDVIRLTETGGVFDSPGSFESIEESFAGDVSYVDLIVNHTIPGDASIAYQVSVDGGSSWQSITPVSADGGTTVNLLNRKYFTNNPVGDSVKLRAILTKSSNDLTPFIDMWSIDVRYTTYVNAVLVDNSFPENTRGMTGLVCTYHDEANECIKLSKIAPVYTNYYQTGTVQSTVRYTSNDAIKACLEVEEAESPPTGTDITYYISTQGGASGTWEEIEPGDASVFEDWMDIAVPGRDIVVKAELTSDGTGTPELHSWKLSIKEKIAGQPHMVKLVDEPWNLSTFPGANYMTLLRWEASETEDVVYNVYRSMTPHFVPSASTLVAEGLSDNSWSDYNLNYGQSFYYKVTAVKLIGGNERESLPSNEAWATVVSQDEVEKRLGLQNYWGYTGFNTGSGTGYVNVSNGNLVYSATDMVVSGPFFASVMRRTFNSMADTKTPMGYGWDFSFNTCLMKEYSGSSESGMILKDGDGSFHRFVKNGSVYNPAVGTFMELTYNSTLDEYQIKRKDNIIYHFDAQSMKLKSFSDNNGNELLFSYDERGNLSEVENTVGEKVALTYSVAGAEPEDPDYTYVNEHPDMLESITWTEDVAENPVSITYNYEYDSNDRLTRAYTTVEDSVTYEEVFTYDETADKKLVTIKDPEQIETDISYDASERVSEITDATDDYYDFTYADIGEEQNRTTITNKYDVSIKYEYNDDGLIYKKTNALNQSIYYTYNNDFLVTGMNYQNYIEGGTTAEYIYYYYYYDSQGNITSISGPDGSLTTYGTYNSFNKPASIGVKKRSTETLTTYYTYDGNGNVLTVTDPKGKVTTNTYSTVNGDSGYLTQVEGDFGNQIRYTYDDKGRVTQIKDYDDGVYERTSVTYAYEFDIDDYFMRVISTDAMSNSTKTYYDRLGRSVKTTYPDDEVSFIEYDLAGSVTETTDRMGHEVDFAYDDLYRLTGATYPDSSTNSIQYLKWDSDNNAGTGDASGNDADKVVKTDGTGAQSIEYYDIAGRLLKTYISDGTSEIVTAQYEYDLIGNCIKVTDNAGRESEAEYDALGRTTKTIVDPTGENIETTFTYDLLGNQLSVTDGEGYTTIYEYDDISRLELVKQDNPYDVDENDGIDPYLATAYEYDFVDTDGYIKNSVKHSTINDNNDFVTANALVSQAWFDELGRKVKDNDEGNTGDSVVMEMSYSYDANFRPSIVTRNDNTKEKYTYNSLGQVTRIDYYEAAEITSTNSDDYIVYTYDDNGNVTLESVYHGTAEESTAYSYDEMGRVSTITEGDLLNGGLSIDYEYDDADRVVLIEYTKASAVRYLKYDYDDYGRIRYIKLALDTTPEYADTVREYVYKANGDLDHMKNFREFSDDGTSYIKTAYEINDAGLTTKITYTDHVDGSPTGTKKEEYTMTYDDRGFIMAETAYTNYGTAATVNKSFTYDSIGRLTQAAIGSETKDYTYDDVGNRLTMSDGTDSFVYSYNQFNQMTATTKNSQSYASYTYDGRGNQTQEQRQVDFGGTIKTQTTNYTYDMLNALTGVSITATGETTLSETNVYNAAGQRVKRVENSDTTKYYYSGSAILFTTDANNFLLTENILDLGGNIVASLRFEDQDPGTPDPYADNYYFYNYDMRGSTTAIIQPNGSLIKGYSYDEFGQLEQTGASGFLNEVTYTGSVTDTSTGLQYMNARFYNPSTGRFLSQDSYKGNAYDPWTQHLYGYCGNNPVNMTDPTGHSATSADLYKQANKWYSTYKSLKKQSKLAYYMGEKWEEAGYSSLAKIQNKTGKILGKGASMALGAYRSTKRAANAMKVEEDEKAAIATEEAKEEVPIFVGGTPTTGSPNDWLKVSDNTWRYYNDKGMVDYDIDIDGPSGGGHKYPHQHDWDGEKRGEAHDVTRPLPPKFALSPDYYMQFCPKFESNPLREYGEEIIVAALAAALMYLTNGAYCPAF